MNERIFYQAVILGGVVSSLSVAVPLLNIVNCFCCLGIASGGLVAVLYIRKYNQINVFTLPEIIRIGLVSGLIGAALSFILHYIIFLLYGNWEIELFTNMIENMDEIPPMWESFYKEFNSPEFQGFAGASILIRDLILFPLFSFLGALLTNRSLAKKTPDK